MRSTLAMQVRVELTHAEVREMIAAYLGARGIVVPPDAKVAITGDGTGPQDVVIIHAPTQISLPADAQEAVR